jgi:predicted small lipoprotein YifL
MSRTGVSLAALAVLGFALAGCGKQGPLERPPPLFGAKAKAQYNAEKTLQGQQAAEADARKREAERAQEADQPDNNDNAPPTPRDIKDPAQSRAPASVAPIQGAPTGPFGPRVSVTPAN